MTIELVDLNAFYYPPEAKTGNWPSYGFGVDVRNEILYQRLDDTTPMCPHVRIRVLDEEDSVPEAEVVRIHSHDTGSALERGTSGWYADKNYHHIDIYICFECLLQFLLDHKAAQTTEE